MPRLIDCFKKHNIPGLKAKYESQVKDGMSDAEKLSVATQIALEHHKELHDELNTFKKEVGVQEDEYISPSKDEAVKAIQDKYNKEIEAKKNKLSEENKKRESEKPVEAPKAVVSNNNTNTDQNGKGKKENQKREDVLTSPTPEEVGAVEKTAPTLFIDGKKNTDSDIEDIVTELQDSKIDVSKENIIANIDENISAVKDILSDPNITTSQEKDAYKALNELTKLRKKVDKGTEYKIQSESTTSKPKKENATQEGKKSESNKPEHKNGNGAREITENGNGDSVEQSRKEPTKEKEVGKPAIETLEEEYNSKTIPELIAIKKKLYGKADIESPMSPEEKLLNKVLAEKQSIENQKVIEKRKLEDAKPSVITNVQEFKKAIKKAIPSLGKKQLETLAIQAEQLKNFTVKEFGLSEEEAWRATQGEIVKSLEELGAQVQEGLPLFQNPQNESLNLQKIIEYANQFTQQGRSINRLSPEAEQGRSESGRINQEATVVASAIYDANRKNEGTKEELSQKEVRDLQESALEELAKKNGYWIEPDTYGKSDYRGTEQLIYDNGDGTVTKINNGNMHPNDWTELFDRIALHNQLNPNDKIVIKGFTKHKFPNKSNFTEESFGVVLEQPFIKQSGEDITYDELVEDQRKRGFELIPEEENGGGATQYDFRNKELGLLSLDNHGENVIRDENGVIHYIDSVITLDSDSKGFEGTNEINEDYLKEQELPLFQEKNAKNTITGTEVSKRVPQDEQRSSAKGSSVNEKQSNDTGTNDSANEQVKSPNKKQQNQIGDGEVKGAANIQTQQTFYGELADISTAIHEPHHHFLGLVDTLASQGNAKAIAMQRTINQWTESKEGKAFAEREGLEQNYPIHRQELFARSAEKYFMEGKRAGFSERISKVFEAFKTFLNDIYEGVVNSPYKIQLSPEIRDLFDTIYGKEKTDNDLGKKVDSDVVKEIKSKKLSHVSGLSMGSNQAEGTYVSTEELNRYGEGKNTSTVEVSINNPLVASDGLIELRTKVLNDNKSEFNTLDFELGTPIEGPFNIEQLTNSGNKKLATLVTRELKSQGYDSIYFPESNTQEGELVVFDKNKVKINLQNEPESKIEQVAAIEAIENQAKNAEDNQDKREAQQVIDKVDVVLLNNMSRDQQARFDGQKVVEGQVVKRQGKVNAIIGKAVDVLFSKGVKQPAKYAVVEREDLQPSHKSGVVNNLHFIPEAQPRDRGALAVLKNEAKAKSDKLDPSQLVDNNIAYYGSPIINERGEVIQGNGRAEAIDFYYQNDKEDSKGYREMLKSKAKELGISEEALANMKEPILVRMAEVNDEEAIILGNYKSSDLEDAKQKGADAKGALNRLSQNDLVELSNAIGSKISETDTLKGAIRDNAKPIIDLLIEKGALRGDMMEQYFNKDGVTPEGIEDTYNIVRQLLFEGGRDNLSSLFDNLPYSQREAIEKTIPAILSNKELKNHVQNAIEILYEKGESGTKTFDTWAKQMDMFKGNTPIEVYSAEDMELARRIDEAKNQKAIATTLIQLATDMNGTDEVANLFGITPAVAPKSFNEALGLPSKVYFQKPGEKESLKELIKRVKEIKVELDGMRTNEDSTTQPKEETKTEEIVTPPSGITHASTAETRDEFGFGEYEKEVITDIEQNRRADEEIRKGYNIEKLLKKLDSGDIPTSLETVILKKYKAILDAKVSADPSNENIEELRRLVEISDKSRSDIGRALRAGRGDVDIEETLGDYFIREMEASKVDVLTDAQKIQVKEEFDNISKAKIELENKLAELEEENNRLKALKEVRNVKSNSKKTNKSPEDYKLEREKTKQDIANKWREAGKGNNMLTSVIVPLPFGKIKQLATVAPDVKKLVKNYVEEGIDNLNSIIDNIHTILADEIDGITKNDIRDIIAGNYDVPKITKSEIQTMVMDLKTEAQLLSKIEILENGGQPNSEEGKKLRNQRTKELRDRVRELKSKTGGENTANTEASKLNAVKTKLENEIKKLEEELRTGNFEFAEEHKPIELDKEAIDLKDKFIKLKYERAKRLIQEEYATRSTGKKIGDTALEILNVPRTLMSSFDFSAPLRQGLIPTISHPLIAGPALVEMFKQAVSQKRFDRWFHDLRESPFFNVISKSGLYVADPHDIRLSTKEEYFMNNYAEKIPLIGKVIKGSERAYVTYLNKMRVDLFKQGVEVLAAQGKTFDNSPEVYKGLANFINNSTGRGELGKLEDYAPILNSIFFSPRLIASRLNLLNPAYYAKLPKEIRVRALADMGKFIGFGLSVLALLKYGFPCKDKNDKDCVEVQSDPRSSEFGKIKVGNTRYDTWGGFQQYITFLTKAILAEKITQGSDRVQELDGRGRGVNTRLGLIGTFVRGKLAPIPGLGIDYLSGRTQDYQKFSWKKEAENKLLPLIYSDLKEAVSQDGVKSLFTVGIPGAFGIGVQTYDDKKSNK